MASSPAAPARLVRSAHLSWFGHMGAVYLFHDLYGYLMEMSADISELVEAFAAPSVPGEVCARFAGRFGDADPAQFVEVLSAHAVLVEPDEDELDGIWAMVPVRGKWNVWQRRGETLTLWTAWGERPLTRVLLDREETEMWDAFDGEKRLIELRQRFSSPAALAKLAALVRRLVHSDVQALKLGQMPMSTYAKRPQMAPPYLTSTMPYPSWQPGTPVPGALGSSFAPTAYYEGGIDDAAAQFDHRETTLSHLFRVPHPALAGRTYGAALVDGLRHRRLPPPGPIRVLEIGAGLGYMAAAVFDRLTELGYQVTYTIVELAPALAEAQRARLAPRPVEWVAGDVLGCELARQFDLILANEMVGDLPALQLSRADIGMNVDGTGVPDAERLRALGGGAAKAAELSVRLDDAPEPFYLQTGAIELVWRLGGWLAPGGLAMLTEFGDAARWPRLSTQLDHPELSTHFGHLQQAGEALGLEGQLAFVIDVIDIDRDQRGLATTRSHFRALQALFAEAGVALEKIGYTPELLERAVAGKLDLGTVGELRWDRIEDRLMGLVPHEFKLLTLVKPG